MLAVAASVDAVVPVANALAIGYVIMLGYQFWGTPSPTASTSSSTSSGTNPLATSSGFGSPGFTGSQFSPGALTQNIAPGVVSSGQVVPTQSGNPSLFNQLTGQ